MLNDIISNWMTRGQLYTVSIYHVCRNETNQQESGSRDYFKKQKFLQG